ncbi:dCTP deaminase [Bradyrhizobium sp. GM6.1]
MQLKRSALKDALDGKGRFEGDRLRVIPQLSPPSDDKLGNASLDLRLGRWFLTLHSTGLNELNFKERPQEEEHRYAQKHFVRFDDQFYLHPGRFLLGATLEWIRMPDQCCGAIVGKSSLGRHGLIIETAPVVHPGFSGCLTLELANVGEIPIALYPGMEIAQLQILNAEGDGISAGRFKGLRRPILGSIGADPVLQRLRSTPASSGNGGDKPDHDNDGKPVSGS